MKFKVGEKVRLTGTDLEGVVVSFIHDSDFRYVVHFNEGSGGDLGTCFESELESV